METKDNNSITSVVAPIDATVPKQVSEQHAKARFRLSRRWYWMLSALIIIGIGIFTYHWAIGKNKTHYVTATVTHGDIESTVVEEGIVQPIKYVDVGAQTSGVLQSLKVLQGDHVQKNQLLAEIDPVLANTALMSANAAFNNMADQRVDKQALLSLARIQYARNEDLFAKGFVSASALDVTRATSNAALADVNSISAQMKEATAAVNTAKANVGYTKITAPMAGEVVSISMLQGQTLNANQSAPIILRIADTSTVTVWAQVSEADIIRVKPGQNVYFTVLGGTRRWNGKIRQILPSPELINNVVFYDVLFDIPNSDGVLKIQMTAQVFIVLAQAKNVLLIPIAAIGNAGAGATITVKVLLANGRVVQRLITIGVINDISAQVTNGLQEHDTVIIGSASATKKTTSNNALSGHGGH